MNLKTNYKPNTIRWNVGDLVLHDGADIRDNHEHVEALSGYHRQIYTNTREVLHAPWLFLGEEWDEQALQNWRIRPFRHIVNENLDPKMDPNLREAIYRRVDALETFYERTLKERLQE